MKKSASNISNSLKPIHIHYSIGLIILLLLCVAILILSKEHGSQTQINPTLDVRYSCDNSKHILSIYTKEKVSLTLNDTRHLALDQVISGSGVRYANDDESIVFWNKGTTAMLTEHGSETYSNCVQISETPHPSPSHVTVTGEFICLPHYKQLGSQTTDCAFGIHLKDGSYIAIKDSDPTYGHIASITSGNTITASGIYTPQQNDQYPITGILELYSVTYN